MTAKQVSRRESYEQTMKRLGKEKTAKMAKLAKSDEVKEPTHYARWAIEPIDMIMHNGLEFWRGNIIKYVMRAGYKQGSYKTTKEAEIADLNKAARYIEMRINQLQGKDITE